jgi:hypothetical protein
MSKDDISHSHSRENLKSSSVFPYGVATHQHIRLIHTVFLRRMFRLLVTAAVVPSSPILVTLMMEAIHASVTSFLTRATRSIISEDVIHHSHRREHLNSYIISLQQLWLIYTCLFWLIRVMYCVHEFWVLIITNCSITYVIGTCMGISKLLQNRARFKVFTAVTMTNVTPCSFCKTGRFGGT